MSSGGQEASPQRSQAPAPASLRPAWNSQGPSQAPWCPGVSLSEGPQLRPSTEPPCSCQGATSAFSPQPRHSRGSPGLTRLTRAHSLALLSAGVAERFQEVAAVSLELPKPHTEQDRGGERGGSVGQPAEASSRWR